MSPGSGRSYGPPRTGSSQAGVSVWWSDWLAWSIDTVYLPRMTAWRTLPGAALHCTALHCTALRDPTRHSVAWGGAAGGAGVDSVVVEGVWRQVQGVA
ncbi:hypothetical protein GCM10023322_43940 [Rugosimonospora acidiphila]|uniref:Uncharacterized protein n=1 Tax=Rugosimonospora acidiphila TaxID=556531 RepID=A0ABP9S283_9ACTN